MTIAIHRTIPTCPDGPVGTGDFHYEMMLQAGDTLCDVRAGASVRGAMPRGAAFTQALCADAQGFSLHGALRCAGEERQRLEQLCRYITRPALANERVQCNSARQVVLKLKTPWHDGTTHIVMSPLTFMQRLAALVPRPKPDRPTA